ncbi:MAG: hypothetical protein A2075_23365 [Geobacteraceae bacterium GWC2_58_44]|nr:MAG: hypothetical protein A2075_23365 [Geobacteraceae bacterium GWC2_58_44]
MNILSRIKKLERKQPLAGFTRRIVDGWVLIGGRHGVLKVPEPMSEEEWNKQASEATTRCKAA